MWRSKARAFLFRSLGTNHQFQAQVPLKTLTLTLIPTSRPLPSRLIQNPRFFSTDDAVNPSVAPALESNELDSGDASGWNFGEESGEASGWSFDDGDDKGGVFAEVADESGDSVLLEGEGDRIEFESVLLEGEGDGVEAESVLLGGEGDGVEAESVLLGGGGDGVEAESVLLEGEGDGVEAEPVVANNDTEEIDRVVAILKGDSEEAIETSLDDLELSLSKDFVLKVIEASKGVGKNLIAFFTWALKKEESVRNVGALELLVQSVKSLPELSKWELYMLWDLMKELGKEKCFLSTPILNALIYMFWKVGKAKAGFEVFSKFDEFGCTPDADTYYHTIQALGEKPMLNSMWSVCEKMLDSGNLPDKKKIGKIIFFLCRKKQVKDAHLIYLMAKEKDLSPPIFYLNFLICGLSRVDDCVPLALELLEDYPTMTTNKHANKIFSSVVQGLCRIKKLNEAKKLLLRMLESGPAPGSACFNFVISALAKEGQVDDAAAWMKTMEGRGLRPDVYTYTVVMGGYVRVRKMNKAYEIYCEAKQRHQKLTPVTYHILTRGYCKMNKFDKALELMKEMKEYGVRPTTDEYNKMIVSLCVKALDWHAADKLFEEMKESGLYLKGSTRSLISAVKELEEEVTEANVASIEA